VHSNLFNSLQNAMKPLMAMENKYWLQSARKDADTDTDTDREGNAGAGTVGAALNGDSLASGNNVNVYADSDVNHDQQPTKKQASIQCGINGIESCDVLE
jgi:hypothetical protein